MTNLTNLHGLSLTVLNFSGDFSPLLVGLAALVGLSVMAVRHYWSEQTKRVPWAAPVAVVYRDAA